MEKDIYQEFASLEKKEEMEAWLKKEFGDLFFFNRIYESVVIYPIFYKAVVSVSINSCHVIYDYLQCVDLLGDFLVEKGIITVEQIRRGVPHKYMREDFIDVHKGKEINAAYFAVFVDSDYLRGLFDYEMKKERIKDIVSAEDSKQPYSDKQIAELLRDHNIDITQRKVAELRDEMGILIASKRKT